MPAFLETRDLKKHYRMGESTVRALDAVSIAVDQGEFIGLLGPSASGKSTLLNLIAGLDRATEASLRVFGDDLAQIQSQGGPTGNLFSLPLWLVAGAIGFAFVVSLIAGSYPASRAARLDPIQALRHD